MLHLLALSGSLRAVSSNTSLLQATALLAPAQVSISLYQGLDQLPHFNPDIEHPLPASVLDLQSRIAQADGLLISCPEYARGIPGAFKNALDWLVGSLDFPGKPVALFNASPRASDAQAALRLVLSTMSADIVDAASISAQLLARGLDARTIAADPALAPLIHAALAAFAQHIRNRRVVP
ncbi:NADPH-dependent FMN reductase [Herbaspirillum autotrophicum]|uniref:NADPH-dependent FMN reductase n=1 Tax=Herbaspirillum autotrophicum TaxID=180195 RepID=UPI00067ABCB8|nr:NADPH-dependent FMN reductase [Herbaspirillum autotrophicum]